MRRIAIWLARPDSSEAGHLLAAFRQRLGVLGWADGLNLRADYRWGVSDLDYMRTVAKEITNQRPDVVLAEGTPLVALLSRESGSLPIVFVNVSDAVGSGFVASMARPGGAITGFTSNEPTLGGKWPQLLKEIVPGVRRIALMFNPETAPYSEA